MTKPLAGVRILEVASHVFVPIGGAILTEWGAEVIKIEHPVTGDPYRGLVTAGLHKSYDGIDPSFQFTNRGKQSVTIDLKHPEGRELLYRLIARCDVFLTNFRPQALRKLRLTCEDVRQHNPAIIYASGTGYGPRGPDAERGGYDSAAYWSRVGFAEVFTPAGADFPTMQRPAFGDVVGGLTVAGAIAAAMYRRQASGEPSEIDVSLMGVGMWQLQPDIVHAKLDKGAVRQAGNRKATWNPLSSTYRTRDGRFISLVMLDADRYWADFCEVVGRPDLINDPRYLDMEARKQHAHSCVEELDAIFAERDYSEWCEVLKRAQGVWAPFQRPYELHSDPQVEANGYLADVEMVNGSKLTIVTSPAQFDGENMQPTRAPEHGEHTETVLLNLGLSWDEIARLKDDAVIG
jgi:crotonobetainyl-CoA:carnitine CoA-transferase CaiB-like acyl-CoA transferase